MIVTAYRTPKIVVGSDLFATLNECLPKLSENSIVVITSKIISICQGRVVKNDGAVDKHDLVRKESDYFIENKSLGQIGFYLTIKNDILIANSGIDESNGNGYFIT